ncbi:MAG: hypothetical protein IJ523_09195 [Succinivibrionaceae bacterium]|nr:hypothetical protein [Succinivibrionaceae bacterium]
MYKIGSNVEFFISKLPAEEQKLQLRLLKKCLGYADSAARKADREGFVLETGKTRISDGQKTQEVMQR